jgi:hypothetical protein
MFYLFGVFIDLCVDVAVRYLFFSFCCFGIRMRFRVHGITWRGREWKIMLWAFLCAMGFNGGTLIDDDPRGWFADF